MEKLNDILKVYKIKAYGFPAFKELEKESNQDGDEVIISILSPAVMNDMGINTYLAPILPRGAVYKTAQDIINADLNVNHVTVLVAPDIDPCEHVLIVSRHAGTVEILKEIYPDSVVLDAVTEEQIKDKNVIGTLPPHLIQHVHRYKAVTIEDFDYNKDQDLEGQELRQRIRIADKSITLAVK